MKKAMNNKEVKEFLEKLRALGIEFSKKDHFDIDDDVILINNEPMFFYHEERLLPTLKMLLKKNILKKITVDMGAVKFIVAGADIMRPGITDVEEGIQKGDAVAVVDVAHGKPLAVGFALFSGDELRAMATGKAIKNRHYVGDEIWNYQSSLKSGSKT
jgi:PUA domain protein